MIRFSDPLKLKTKKIVFEEVYIARDPTTLEHLQELSAKRKAIEESINDSSGTIYAIARGTSSSRVQQELQKVEEYLALLETLLFHVKLIANNRKIVNWTSKLKIRWSSGLGTSNGLKLCPAKFYQVDDLSFEHGMTLFLYGAILRERAVEILSTDLVQASALYKTAAGVFGCLAEELLPALEPALPQDRPPEVTPCLNSILSLICLAEAQAVFIRNAEQTGKTAGVLAKLHYGIKQFLDAAITTLHSSKSQGKMITARLEDYICSFAGLNELKSQRYVAEGNKDDHIGFAIAVLRRAVHNMKGKAPKDESWRVGFKEEVNLINGMLRKLEHDNNVIYYDKIPYPDQLPPLEGVKFVSAIPYSSPKCETKLAFKI